eukprot:1147314-Pelagomonas_calceolata.AAC.12
MLLAGGPLLSDVLEYMDKAKRGLEQDEVSRMNWFQCLPQAEKREPAGADASSCRMKADLEHMTAHAERRQTSST